LAVTFVDFLLLSCCIFDGFSLLTQLGPDTRGATAGTALWDTEIYVSGRYREESSLQTRAAIHSGFASALQALAIQCSTDSMPNKSRTHCLHLGLNDCGQLGLGDLENRNYPCRIDFGKQRLTKSLLCLVEEPHSCVVRGESV